MSGFTIPPASQDIGGTVDFQLDIDPTLLPGQDSYWSTIININEIGNRVDYIDDTNTFSLVASWFPGLNATMAGAVTISWIVAN
jgi:hypothetical protein